MKISKYSIRFNPEKRTGKIEQLPLNMDISFLGRRARYYTGYRIELCNWIKEDEKSGELIQRLRRNTITKDGISAALINRYLGELETHVHNIFQDSSKNIQTENDLKTELLKRLSQGKSTESKNTKGQIDFFDLFERYTNEADVSKLRRKQLKSTMTHFKNFAESRNLTLNFEKCTPSLIADFKKYLEISRDEESDKSPNTITGILSKLRCFFSYAKKPEINWSNYSPFPEYKIESAIYGDPIYLSKEERDFLYYATIDEPRLERVRDLFVLQCFLGPRIGDYIKLKKSNIINGVLHYIPEKTANEVQKVCKVPLSEKATAIINKYDMPDDSLMPFISEQKYNDYLKELFRKLELNRPVVILNPNTRHNEIIPLSEVVSSHMARRTFIGLLHRRVKNEVIASMSGHRENSKAFSRYYSIDDESRKDAIKEIE